VLVCRGICRPRHVVYHRIPSRARVARATDGMLRSGTHKRASLPPCAHSATLSFSDRPCPGRPTLQTAMEQVIGGVSAVDELSRGMTLRLSTSPTPGRLSKHLQWPRSGRLSASRCSASGPDLTAEVEQAQDHPPVEVRGDSPSPTPPGEARVREPQAQHNSGEDARPQDQHPGQRFTDGDDQRRV